MYIHCFKISTLVVFVLTGIRPSVVTALRRNKIRDSYNPQEGVVNIMKTLIIMDIIMGQYNELYQLVFNIREYII